MSFVYDSKHIQATTASVLNSYTNIFWDWLDGEPRLQFSYPGMSLNEGDYYREKQKLFHEWLSGGQGISSVFYQDWKYWKWPRYGSPELDQLANDWVPPSEQILYGLQPLPQFPQVRRRIVGPDGLPRSVRLKTFKGVHI